MKIESTLSGTGVGSTVSVYPTVMNNVFGTKFKLIMGYKGSNEAMLAVERGEVEGHSTSWTALKVAHPDWIPENKSRSWCSSPSSGTPKCPTFRPPSTSPATTRSARSSRDDERGRGRHRILHDARPCRPTGSTRCAARSTPR